MEKRYWNQGNPAKLLTDFLGNVSWTILKSKIPFDTQGWMLCRVLTTLQFLPVHHTNSREERNERSSALCISYMCYSMWIIDTHPVWLIFNDTQGPMKWTVPTLMRPYTIGFQWRRDLHECRNSAQHACDTLDTQPVRLNFHRYSTEYHSSPIRVAFGMIHFNFPSLGLQ
jgi:hypothetical protein